MSEAFERKRRSEAICRREGVPFLSSLPVIEDKSNANIRTVEEVAWRAMALCLVAVKGEGLEQEEVLSVLEDYELEPVLTPKERIFIFDSKPSDRDRVQFAWRYECYWVMLWAISYIEEMGRPDHICNVPRAVGVMMDRTSREFVRDARLRGAEEILDEADLTYRYDWACVNARLNGKTVPAGLDAGVVMERHYALNWLVGYAGQEWDDVSTDT
jgi:hypothetical protein